MKVKESIFNFEVINNSKENTLKEIQQFKKEQKLSHIVTLNPEIIIQSQSNPSLESTLKKADMIIPDGIGVSLAAKLKNNTSLTRFAGIELAQEVLAMVNSCYLIGRINIDKFGF